MLVGDLVESNSFSGIGKILELSSDTGMAEVGFFESPLQSTTNPLQLDLSSLRLVSLNEEKVIYCRHPQTGIWCRARYIGERLDEGKHLVVFRKGENALISAEEIFCLNLGSGNPLNPAEFLAVQANEAPFFFQFREDFVTSYLEQRAACRSISSIPSSSVELEVHQLAVVRRVLQDPEPKYLLADEVGLGKTIETGLIIREHILEKKRAARVVVAVPRNLIGQWRQELATRFFLEELFCDDGDDGQIKICAHEDLQKKILNSWRPSLFAVDEAHQLARMAWSENSEQRELYSLYAQCTEDAEVALLLSGTPLHGNEKNFLAMLHCLNPQAYSLDDAGVGRFMQRVEDRERLGGLYGAFIPESQNASLESIVNDLAAMFPADNHLMDLLNHLRPLVDIFAPQEGEERREAILNCRRYLGEHYRLHQRLLRNRRENSDLEILFPGLAGLIKQYWKVDAYDITLDELLDEFRSQAIAEPDYFKTMSQELCLDWVDDLLTSPLVLEKRAAQVLIDCRDELSEQELDILEQLIELGKKEQRDKDQALVSALKQWFQEYPDGKAVVFCTQRDVATHLYETLHVEFQNEIALNRDEDIEPFNNQETSVRVLLCDRRGEDGLNLHGGNRLAVHYSLPRDFSRIEQRLGRLNRYSANLYGVKPVQSMVLLPERLGVTGYWVELLENSMQAFNKTLASLQYMLEEQMESAWQTFYQEGCSVFSRTGQRLVGENGLIAVESRRVQAQEELLSMEEEVQEAFEFADQLEEADEIAEEQVRRMTGWITKALQFRQFGERGEGFRFQFVLDPARGPRTLVDAQTFISTCLLGLDRAGGYPPVTMKMSASRTKVSHGKGLYPFRYGQPFVDTIWDLLKSDARGTSMAFLRVVLGEPLEDPSVCFRFSWLLTAHEYGAGRRKQRIADEHFPLAVETLWLQQDGRLLDGDTSYLEKPYDKRNGDINLRSSVWDQLKDWFPADQWQRTVLSVTEQSRHHCLEKYDELDGDLHTRLLSCKAVILCSPGMFSHEGTL